jgi:hypothetical protein
MVYIPLSSFQFGSQRAEIRLEGHQGVRRYIRLLRDKVAEPIFRTCIGAAPTTFGRQVSEAYCLAIMGRDGFANKLNRANCSLTFSRLLFFLNPSRAAVMPSV